MVVSFSSGELIIWRDKIHIKKVTNIEWNVCTVKYQMFQAGIIMEYLIILWFFFYPVGCWGHICHLGMAPENSIIFLLRTRKKAENGKVKPVAGEDMEKCGRKKNQSIIDLFLLLINHSINFICSWRTCIVLNGLVSTSRKDGTGLLHLFLHRKSPYWK